MRKENTFTMQVQFVLDNLLNEIKQITGNSFVGCYLHGSLAMGCFHPETSDIDLLVVLRKTLNSQQKQKLIALFLNQSNRPYPIEISFLLENDLKKWEHPFPYIFHYSEYWRERMKMNTEQILKKGKGKDADIAAHIAVLRNRGVTLEGPPADNVFPIIPKSDYISSIESDYKECLATYIDKPVYAILNMLRFYWYLKEECILSKKEAGEKAYKDFPENIHSIIKSLLHNYQVIESEKVAIEKRALKVLKKDIEGKITEILIG